MADHSFGYAAFAPEDVEDAQRRRPPTDLGAYAAARGWELFGSTLVSTVRAAQPDWAEYTANVVSGAMPDGSYGVIEHELYEVETHASTGIQFGGAFYGARYSAKGPKGFWNKVLPFQISADEPEGPFAGSAAYVPVTAVLLRVPEAALLPRLVIRRSDRMSGVGNTDLGPLGLGGYRLAGTVAPPALVQAVLAAGAGQVLASLPYPFVEARYAYGSLALRCNGYLVDESALDALVSQACGIAAALRSAAAPLLAPRPFQVALEPDVGGPPEWAPWYPVTNHLWTNGFRDLAARHDLVMEQPADLHRANPRLPVAGVAHGVLRGNLPGTQVPGRLVFTGQGGVTVSQVRAGVAMAAPPDAAPTPVGGVMDPATDMKAEIADGVIVCWNRQRSTGGMDTTELVASALATAARITGSG
ncbi:MAG: hypothetical protein KDB35_21035 [Acidimicrobiales bacterium]|nr:hypothetical protein [Acidimicrobiales bacterium]